MDEHDTPAGDHDTPAGDHDAPPRVMHLLVENGRAAWMLVGIILAIGLLGFVFSRVKLILFAVFVALVHAAIVTPIVRWMEAHGSRRTPATALALLLVVSLFGGATTLVGYRLAVQLPGVADRLDDERARLAQILQREPLSLSQQEVEALLHRSVEEVADEAAAAERSTGAAGSADGTSADGSGGEASSQEQLEEADDGRGPSPSTAYQVLRGSAVLMRLFGAMLVGIVLAFFLVRDRDRIADGVVRHLGGGEHGSRARDVLRAGWQALYGYVQASVIIGALEAAAIGLALVIVGTPLAGSLAILTFLAAFVPVVGAIVAGVLAIGVTWLGVGMPQAIAVAVVVLAVQQLDSHVLQPKIVAAHTHLHPIATILALMLGGLVGGILGALLAVPTAAVLVAIGGELLEPSLPPAHAAASTTSRA